MPSSRVVAARVLTDIISGGAYSSIAVNAALKKYEPSDPRDVSLVSALVYSAIEHLYTIDYNLSLYLKGGIKKLPPFVSSVLRIAAAQIFYFDKIPPSAAVNEAVASVKKSKLSSFSGLTNAVLRRLLSEGVCFPDEDSSDFGSVYYSVSQPVMNRLEEYLGKEDAKRFLDSVSGKRPVFAKLNNTKKSVPEIIKALENDGVGCVATAMPLMYILENTGDISLLTAYREGLFHIEDYSCYLCCLALGVTPGDFVIDCCAAPGGKSFSAAEEMNDSGSVISCDMYEHKTALISSGASRLGLDVIKTVCCDARELKNIYSGADRVLCDVPCSGLGIIGRKPEIRYKNDGDFSSLPPLQYEILSSCSDMVKPGGTLVYSTCTLVKAENEDVCERFLSEHPSFIAVPPEDYPVRPQRKFLTLLPYRQPGDGFFIAKFYRKA